ncbi:MAG: filamentous hemagglutinin N-terminal domain-containing protein [Aulosira sp. ZfuVER01]|nr:filamentous hemagglutinin N-terminal domain-containing protein [Aulosira sp. ZfuVER01]MDZ8000375.1 filamentous hemagglutinin N-terminal domain-containing protein [Aulosira sp. DedVER01a]MDZ8052848.1 filamentous hemagglutinin N-terminal domain-containing protein [Aulosira sp. ZfuCHP01]
MSTSLNWFLSVAIASVTTFSVNSAFAQITPDGTLPSNSIVTPQGNTNLIEGGTQAGGNLFHSFQEFSVATGSTAFFNNGADIQNIISRVTGSSVSSIDGLIKANGNANLFLINPQGIIFGQNARLDIGGSFIGSTASSLKFADNLEFNATNPQSTTLLTISAPIGLQYETNPGKIQVQGDSKGRRIASSPVIDTTNALRVQPNQTLALVGGDISLEGASLKTAGGRIELGSVSGAGFVSLSPINKGFSLGYDAVQNFGNIQLFQKAIVDASGKGSGDIQVTGKRITLTQGSQIESSTLGAEAGGEMVVNALESIDIVASSDSGQDTGFFVIAYPGATGKGGNLTINTRDLFVRNGALISSGTSGPGKGGDLLVNASNSVQLVGSLPNFRFYGLFASSAQGATGAAGDVTINTNNLLVKDGARISASTFGVGKGGNVTVNANSVEVMGTTFDGQSSSGLFTRSLPNVTGDAGDLTINTNKLLVRDRGIVTVRSEGKGKAGNLNINASSVRLDNKATLSADTQSISTDPNKEQATITLTSHDLILLRDSRITTNAFGPDVVGGNIKIDTDVLAAFANSDISANSANFRGGRVEINTQGIFGTQLQNVASEQTSDITATGVNSQLNGTVQINGINVDPKRGLVELPSNVVDAAKQIDASCSPGSRQSLSSFAITGRGGLPPNPYEMLTSEGMLVDVITLNRDRAHLPVSVKSTTVTPERIVEVTGWKLNKQGEVQLTANATPHSSWQSPVSCHAS